MADIILALNNESETLSGPEILLRDELVLLGYDVSCIPWLKIDPSELQGHETVVLRTVWDYSIRLPEFRSWIGELQKRDVHLINDEEMVIWNVDKAYLLELSAAGIETPRTCAPSNLDEALAFLDASQSESFIIKPRVGGGGIDVHRRSKVDAIAMMTARSEPFVDVILQEYCPEVEEGEISLVFFYRKFSHAIRRIPNGGDFRANGSYGSTTELYIPPSDTVEAASRIVDCAPRVPVFARIDAFMRGADLICSEFELVDPALFLKYSDGAAERFALAIQEARDVRGFGGN